MRGAPWRSRGRAGSEGAGVRAALSPLPSPTAGSQRSRGAAGPSAAPRAGRTAAAAMAPLLGRKPFPLAKPLPGEEPLFTIAHTQEAFRTREYPFPAGTADRAGAGRSGGSAPRGGQLSARPAAAGPRFGSARRSGARERAAGCRGGAAHFVPGPGDGERTSCPLRLAVGPERRKAGLAWRFFFLI